MGQFRTEITVEPFQHKIEPHTKVMFVGSCFANNIGDKFDNCKLNASVNPFGVIYNPISVATTLTSILNNKAYIDTDLRYHNDLWLSFDHHSSFSDNDKSTCLENININCHSAFNHLSQCEFIFITFGSAWVYQLKETGQIVSNCHKYPADYFNRYMLSIEDIILKYTTLLTQLLEFNPNIKIVFTVSPVRHWKDGAHGNQLSKSTLLMAIDKLCGLFTSCHYFPAYELLMDDLRDYRFYADDMLHPSPSAIEYIYQKFEQCFFSDNTLQYKKEMLTLYKALHHKASNVNSESHQLFLKNQLKKIEGYNLKYPHANFSEESTFVKKNLLKSNCFK